MQGAQQLRLPAGRQVFDILEENGAAIGLGEFADLSVVGASEGALLVPEQQGLHAALWQSGAVHGEERAAAAFGGAMDGAGDQLLADALLPFDQHGDGRFCSSLAQAPDPVHFLRGGGDVAKGDGRGAAPGRAAHLFLEGFEPHGVLDRDLQTLRAYGLDDEIKGPRPRGGHDGFDGCGRGLHDDRGGETALAHAQQHAHAIQIGHDQIKDQAVHARQVSGHQAVEGGFAPIDQLGVIAESADHGFEEPTLNGVVVGDQDGQCHAVASIPGRNRSACEPMLVQQGKRRINFVASM